MLNTLRNVPTNGYTLPVLDSLNRVQMGATPSPAAALAMANEIVASRAGRWPARIADCVLGERILKYLAALLNLQLLSQHPVQHWLHSWLS